MAGELYKSKAFMTRRYLREKKSPEDIAKELNTSRATIYRWLERHGLIRK